MQSTFPSDGLQIHGYTALPERLRDRGTPTLVLCHGYPDVAVGAAGAGGSYPALADRIAEELGWIVFTFNYRGCGRSEGNFSAAGWLRDVHAAVAHVRAEHDEAGVWLAGFGTGGALSVCATAEDPEIRGAACLASPADFSGWASDPEQLLAHTRQIKAITDDDFPADFEAWTAEVGAISAADAAPDVVPRHLLVVHGGMDKLVSPFDARIIADSHGEAELRIIAGSDHRLRYDPRAVAVLLGWLRRQR